MLNKLREFNRKYGLIQPGDTVVCAVSGGADSMALLRAFCHGYRIPLQTGSARVTP